MKRKNVIRTSYVMNSTLTVLLAKTLIPECIKEAIFNTFLRPKPLVGLKYMRITNFRCQISIF